MFINEIQLLSGVLKVNWALLGNQDVALSKSLHLSVQFTVTLEYVYKICLYYMQVCTLGMVTFSIFHINIKLYIV